METLSCLSICEAEASSRMSTESSVSPPRSGLVKTLSSESATALQTFSGASAPVRDFIRAHGAEPSFLNYSGYPGSACISINEVVIHGIPDHRKLMEGDIVSVDVGAYLDGFHGDCCGTFACGKISPEARRLIDVTRQSFFEGIKMATPGHRVSDISHAVQQYVEKNGYSVVRSFVGHGVGAKLHEPAPWPPTMRIPSSSPRGSPSF